MGGVKLKLYWIGSQGGTVSTVFDPIKSTDWYQNYNYILDRIGKIDQILYFQYNPIQFCRSLVFLVTFSNCIVWKAFFSGITVNVMTDLKEMVFRVIILTRANRVNINVQKMQTVFMTPKQITRANLISQKKNEENIQKMIKIISIDVNAKKIS